MFTSLLLSSMADGGGAAEDVLKAVKTVLALCSELLHSLKMQQADEQRSFFCSGGMARLFTLKYCWRRPKRHEEKRRDLPF